MKDQGTKNLEVANVHSRKLLRWIGLGVHVFCHCERHFGVHGARTEPDPVYQVALDKVMYPLLS